MPKRIFITEEAANALFASNDVNAELAKKLDSEGTFFKDSPAFPPVDGGSFEHSIAILGYEAAKSSLDDDILSLSVEEKKSLQSKIIAKCQSIEKDNHKALEKVCFNIVNSLFNIPNGAITFKCHLTNDVSGKERDLQATPQDNPNMKYSSISEMKGLKWEVEKRKILNALTMGYSLKFSKVPKRFIGDIYEINPELPALYKQFAALNSIILYEDVPHEITEKNKYQSGMVDVRITGVGKRTLIESTGIIFPVLLCESIRGFMELFSSHGLPEIKEHAEFVLKKTDCVEGEMWNMILGPGLWEKFSQSIEDMDLAYFPLFFTRLSEIDGEDFCEIMEEVFAGTQRGEDILSDIYSEVTDEVDYDDFMDTIQMKNTEKNMISEKYLKPEDLDTI